MLTAEQEAWLKDLETTDAKQGKSALRSTTDEFCCLGRACVVLDVEASIGEKYISNTATQVWFYNGSWAILSPNTQRRLGLKSGSGGFGHPVHLNGVVYHSLANMNDAGLTFKEIAAFIRANPNEVFKCDSGS